MRLENFCARTCDPRDPIAKNLVLGEMTTLTEHAKAHRDAASVASTDSWMIREIYVDLFIQHFGYRPRINFDDPRVDLVLTRVLSMCLREEIDFATYVTANMHGMKRWVQANRRIGFRPNMLCGDNAMNRYHIYVRRTNRAKRGDVEGFDQRTVLGQYRTEFIEAETLAGRMFIDRALCDRPLIWTEVLHHIANVSEAWRGMIARRNGLKSNRADISSALKFAHAMGDSRADKEVTYARVQAIVGVLRSYRHDLPDLVGCTAPLMDWHDALLVVRHCYEPRKTVHHDSIDAPGMLWGAA